MKKFLLTVGLAIAILFTVIFLRDQLIKSIVVFSAERITGASVRIESFSLGIIKQVVDITGLKIYNPSGFPKGILVDISKIKVGYDFNSLLKKKIYLKEVILDLKELGLVKNTEGKLNVDSLAITDKTGKNPKKTSKELPLKIDSLTLNIGRLVYKDFTSGREPLIQVYDINLKKTYKNINSAQQLVALIITEPMKAAGIRGAAIYGAAGLAGVAVLPVAVAATFLGKDNAQSNLNVAFDKLYTVSLSLLKRDGQVKRDDPVHGVIVAALKSADITVKLTKISDRVTQISVSARQYMFPKPEIAGGVLYQITEELK